MKTVTSTLHLHTGAELTAAFRKQRERAGFETDAHYIRALIKQLEALTHGQDRFDVRDLTLNRT